MIDALFTIIIYPVKLLLECIYAVFYVSVFKENAALSLALLSIAVNTLCLPLYTKAEKLQEAERETQKRMAKRLAAIRRCFSGDERWMITAAYYREQHYHPVYALRSSLSLLLQVPFFIAAYSFLSHLASLQGKSFFLIHDLSKPDALFSIGGFAVNLLPVIMTAVNVTAGMVYSKGFPWKEKAQLYGMSALFLVLLYNSPSALVLYWTMNNLYSLAKNILFKIRHPLRIVYIAGCALCFAFMLYVCFFRYNFPARAFRNKVFSLMLFVVFAGIPLCIKIARHIFHKRFAFIFEIKNPNGVYVLSCAVLWLFTGCFIPLNIAASDPAHFVQVARTFGTSLFSLLSAPAVQGFGLFCFWPLCLYFLAPPKIRSLMTVLFAAAAFCVLVNFFAFNGHYGILSQTLSFSIPDGVYLHKGVPAQLANIGVCLAVFTLVCLAALYPKKAFLPPILSLCVISVCALSVLKINEIRSAENQSAGGIEVEDAAAKIAGDDFTDNEKITFSTNGKNVLFIMLDGAINAYFPLVAEERPDVAEAFKGFTYYPNTVSFYGRTLFGAPPLFGGYEYSAYNMNKRAGVLMREKQNEALMLMPEMFRDHNFEVTVSNLPYVNYGKPLEHDFYQKRSIKTITMQGKYTDKYLKEELGVEKYAEPVNYNLLLRRNLLMFAVMQTSIFTFRDFIYQNGKYWGTADFAENAGAPRSTLDCYAALFYLPNLTEFLTDTGRGTMN